jgi:hypothetical protein
LAERTCSGRTRAKDRGAETIREKHDVDGREEATASAFELALVAAKIRFELS